MALAARRLSLMLMFLWPVGREVLAHEKTLAIAPDGGSLSTTWLTDEERKQPPLSVIERLGFQMTSPIAFSAGAVELPDGTIAVGDRSGTIAVFEPAAGHNFAQPLFSRQFRSVANNAVRVDGEDGGVIVATLDCGDSAARCLLSAFDPLAGKDAGVTMRATMRKVDRDDYLGPELHTFKNRGRAVLAVVRRKEKEFEFFDPAAGLDATPFFRAEMNDEIVDFIWSENERGLAAFAVADRSGSLKGFEFRGTSRVQLVFSAKLMTGSPRGLFSLVSVRGERSLALLDWPRELKIFDFKAGLEASPRFSLKLRSDEDVMPIADSTALAVVGSETGSFRLFDVMARDGAEALMATTVPGFQAVVALRDRRGRSLIVIGDVYGTIRGFERNAGRDAQPVFSVTVKGDPGQFILEEIRDVAGQAKFMMNAVENSKSTVSLFEFGAAQSPRPVFSKTLDGRATVTPSSDPNGKPVLLVEGERELSIFIPSAGLHAKPIFSTRELEGSPGTRFIEKASSRDGEWLLLVGDNSGSFKVFDAMGGLDAQPIFSARLSGSVSGIFPINDELGTLRVVVTNTGRFNISACDLADPGDGFSDVSVFEIKKTSVARPRFTASSGTPAERLASLRTSSGRSYLLVEGYRGAQVFDPSAGLNARPVVEGVLFGSHAADAGQRRRADVSVYAPDAGADARPLFSANFAGESGEEPNFRIGSRRVVAREDGFLFQFFDAKADPTIARPLLTLQETRKRQVKPLVDAAGRRLLVVGEHGHRIRILDPARPRERPIAEAHLPEGIVAVSVARNGTIFVTCVSGRIVFLRGLDEAPAVADQ
ncbi:MAG: hypothetical protein Q8S33_26360 [Myxococcales bacterium]|nr:hypothetical protein [Myxococcales bacterium]